MLITTPVAITLTDGKTTDEFNHTNEYNDGSVLIDFDRNGKIVCIEIISPCKIKIEGSDFCF